MKLTRRDFIKASVATTGLLVAGCATQGETPVTSARALRKARPAGPAKGEWVATACQGCTQWCAIQIFVQDGRAVRVRGNPLSKTNHGYCCPRGHLIPQQNYSPDRVKTPMKRTVAAKGLQLGGLMKSKDFTAGLDYVSNTVTYPAPKPAGMRTKSRPRSASV